MTAATTDAVDRPLPTPGAVMSALRTGVGVISWASPSLAGRVFLVGDIGDEPRAAVITRLFGIRELALAQALRHPDPAVRRVALQAGVAIDGFDVVASLLALRRGAPKGIWLSFAAGAATFVALGAASLKELDRSAG